MNNTILLISILALLGLVVVFYYNSLVKLNVSVDESLSQIEVQLKRRSDLIPNLVETVKGYASHEKNTLQAVTDARAASQSATTIGEISKADGALTNALRGLLAVAENYPDLKASANFLSLQEELSTTENKVSFARQFYNDQVRSLNQKVKTFPGNIFAGTFNIKERDFYEVEDKNDLKKPEV